MTPERRGRFEAEWPGLATRLAVYLHRRSVREGQVEDILQETALRLFRMWGRVVPDAPLWPLVRTIALNVLRDRSRRCEEEPIDPLPEEATESDAADAGMARVELGRVQRALGELTGAQRDALLAEIGIVSTAPRTPAGKMLRLRARKKLMRLLERAPLAAPLRSVRLWDLGYGLPGFRDAVVGGASCLACIALGFGAMAIADSRPGPAISVEVIAEEVEAASSHPSARAPGFTDPPRPAAVPISRPEASRLPSARTEDRSAASSGSEAPLPSPPVPVVPEEIPLPQAYGSGEEAIVLPEEPVPSSDEGRDWDPLPVFGDDRLSLGVSTVPTL